MKKNISRIEAAIRLVLGSLLFYYFMIGGPSWALLGLYFMLSGSFRFCLFYYYLLNKSL